MPGADWRAALLSDLQQLSGPTEVTALPLHSCLTAAVLQMEPLLKVRFMVAA